MKEQRILVVDDNMDSATSLTTLLQLMGSEAHTAYDGNQAIAMAEQVHPDLILLDIGMPHMNGFEVARHIRAQDWGKEIVLISVTGWGQEEYRRMSIDAGFDSHLIKPINIDDLKSTIASFNR